MLKEMLEVRRESKPLLILVSLFIASVIAYSAFLLTDMRYVDFALISEFFFFVIPGIATFIVYKTYNSIPKGELYRKIWFYIFVAMVFWWLAEMIWAVYDISLAGEVPLITIADVFWMMGYPLVFIAIFKQLKMLGKAGVKPSLLQIFAIIVVCLISLIILTAFIFVPIIEYIPEASFVENLITFIYPLLDTILLFSALALISVFGKSRLGLAWTLILIAFIATGVADLIWFYLSWFEVYFAPGFMLNSAIADILWLLDYVLLGAGATVFLRTIKGKI